MEYEVEYSIIRVEEVSYNAIMAIAHSLCDSFELFERESNKSKMGYSEQSCITP